MKASLYNRIIKLVTLRERHYGFAKDAQGWGKAEKLKAISAIKKKINFYRDRPRIVQARVVCSLRAQLLTIAPGQESRFQKVRAELLSVLQECENLNATIS